MDTTKCVCVGGGGRDGGYWEMVRFVWEGGGGGGVLIFTMECQKLPIEKKLYF